MNIQKPCAIINAKSGSTTDITELLKEKLIAKYDEIGPVNYLDPAKMTEFLEAALSDGCDLVIVYGGDGTALTAAKLATANNVPIVALPGGTMNMLPKALYGTEDWEEALDKALSCRDARWMPAGLINEHMFLCGCLVGTPVRLNDVREEMRDLNIIKAAQDLVFNALDFKPDETFQYGFGGARAVYHSANLLNIVCPQTSDMKTGQTKLEVNAIDIDGLADIASLGWAGLTSDWREDENTETVLSDVVDIRNDDGPLDILLDGEAIALKSPLRVTIEPRGVLVLAP